MVALNVTYRFPLCGACAGRGKQVRDTGQQIDLAYCIECGGSGHLTRRPGYLAIEMVTEAIGVERRTRA